MARLRFLLPIFALLALFPAAAHAEKPNEQALYQDGPEGRYLLDGDWLFRLDPTDQGIKQRWMRSTSKSGWNTVEVPNVWNLGDPSNESMAGGVGWYRKDFELPNADSALEWAFRFESVNYRTRVWLNGKPIGENTGAYIPFEIEAADAVKRRGTNRLVVRVDSKRLDRDFPPARTNADGVPSGGWWNYSGIQREVYLKKLDTVDFQTVTVRPELSCGTCDATVRMDLDLRNVTRDGQRVTVTGKFGDRNVRLGTKTLGPDGIASFTDSIRVADPRLWSPQTPNLYDVSFTVRVDGEKVAGYQLHSGIRSIKVSQGRLFLNGAPLNVRGFGLHEESKADGFAITNERREELVNLTREAGGTVLRTHYPFHPYTHELADRLGLLIWSEIPVYSVSTAVLKEPSVRRLAVAELERMIGAHQNHPSVMVWSIGNELSSQPGPVQVAYINAAAKFAKEMDPTRPVGIAVAAYPSSLCQAQEYKALDVLGFNNYFGWYPGPSGQIFDRTKLSGYLDAVRACYPNQALMVTEFGAEANREGPIEEKGTWAFQQEWINYQMTVMNSKPWLSGVLYWTLNEFWVRPGWEGGNPRPAAPVHQKGLVSYDGVKKPAFFDIQRWFKATPQFGPPPPAA
ncbi:beta galactosidase jelly roll domain-containing protein [Solirubrobacter sp. CPCC 204708]|uniref:Beta galactosidase jelly roll domain-containing protein n=1 Tax=Solirubrobacter deserti TaxID=2282478 RepID=A0ABT4RI47_9ACTN|nr:glycoside hydrolase family 2 TIM barrel-domain containing protein [Solirubrobacter deserti]MBE2318845.1 beta galactosidase jelly roll domain-containing protein [Solirubrobacter deserti]MDA0138225.1 beta galactosidase jelly roll domain-containing protein [Solirubrobacter deserti]